MSSPIAKLLISLGLDAKDVETGVKAAKTSVAGLSSGSKLAFGALGAAATVGFGLATKGALQAEEGVSEYVRATGKSREEGKKFVTSMDQIVGSAGTVGVEFKKIAETGAAVEQQFGTTGDKTRDLTDDIFKFAKVTKQDATQAAMDLEDTLSAFGLGADDASGFMDKLVASSQKFGTDAGPAGIAALRNMAPALTAMGEGLDYGVGALNLFEQAGVDATTGQTAFNKAVDNIPPGGSFDDIIAKLGAIEDPALKDAAAVEIFGEKAGHKMALAIKPGMTSLDDYKISAEESADAVDQSAQDMLTTTDKFHQFADKLGAIFREAGNSFGPLVTAAGTVGPGIAAGLVKSWGKVKDNPAVAGAIGRVTDWMGTALSAGQRLLTAMASVIGDATSAAWDALKNNSIVQKAIGLAGAAASAIYAGAAAVADFLAEKVRLIWVAIGGSTLVTGAAGEAGAAGGRSYLAGLAGIAGGALALGSGAIIGKTVFDGITDFLGDPLNTHGAGDAILKIGQSHWTPAATEAGTAAGEAGAQTYADTIRESLSTEKYGPWLPPGWGTEDATTAGSAAGDAAAQGYGDSVTNSPSWDAAADAAADHARKFWNGGIVDGSAEARARAAKVWADSALTLGADLAGELRGEKVQTLIKGAMDDVLWAINHPLQLNKQVAQLEAAINGQAIADGLASKNDEVRTIASQQQQILIDKWQTLTGKAWTWGSSVGNEWMKGIAAAIRSRENLDKLHNAMNALGQYLHGQSPPPKGPLHEIDKWGFNVGAAWLGGVGDAVKRVGGVLSGAAAGLTPAFGTGLTPAFAGVGGGPGFVTQSIGDVTVNIYDARDPDTTAAKVREAIIDVLGGGGPSPDRSGRPVVR